MRPREERDLRNCPLFSDEASAWENRENMPELSEGESLLSDVIGDEDDILAISAWIPHDLERIGYFALYYRDRARDLVRLSLNSGLGSENYAYVVGYLYRHAIELFMKAIIAADPAFRTLESVEQGNAIYGHDLKVLWDRVKALVADLHDDTRMRLAEHYLLELYGLDKRSDGFRYPFKIVLKTGERKPLLDGLGRASFHNFVWILDALASWFETAEDRLVQHTDSLRELRDSV